ncbi:hypothetical protein RHSIM_Rhsim04G0117700 [Rhododendron simsii]|uniref:Protein COFACTOR ASSEMBLY OF COMPLEX C SUBUNIT B CCB2, chloroplastic n=1 Tax=Rhododendron simsii TaxID=118357 RepID=A0A834H2D4_RHOSS|nr:hypothetical protein RHSIM_Rhsim04G0117700 [Rhododendron simsii]
MGKANQRQSVFFIFHPRFSFSFSLWRQKTKALVSLPHHKFALVSLFIAEAAEEPTIFSSAKQQKERKMSRSLFLNPLLQFEIRSKRKLSTISCTGLDNSQNTTSDQRQLNLSILRFTFGIPGLDESYLPRWIGYAFGSLLLLNHFAGSNSTTPAQLRSEALGLSLAGFSIVLPYLGKFLKQLDEANTEKLFCGAATCARHGRASTEKQAPRQTADSGRWWRGLTKKNRQGEKRTEGATPVDQVAIPDSAEQIFVMSQNIAENVKEDLAWGTYVLLRNTNSISVLILVQGALCVRGYWNTPRDVSKVDALGWFQKQIQQIGFSDLKDTLYFPQCADSEIWEILPKGTRSIIVQPVQQAPKGDANQEEKNEGFVLLASSMSYAYSNKDTAWIGAVANKFGGISIFA